MGRGSRHKDVPPTGKDRLCQGSVTGLPVSSPGTCGLRTDLRPRGWGDKRPVEGANALRKRTIPAQDVYENKNLKNANGPQRGVADSSLVCCT